MNALSWADLTYVLPATSLGYVLLALVAKFALHEQISLLRWIGIALISGGVGFVAGGRGADITPHKEDSVSPHVSQDRARNGAPCDQDPGSAMLPNKREKRCARDGVRAMRHAYTWSGISGSGLLVRCG